MFRKKFLKVYKVSTCFSYDTSGEPFINYINAKDITEAVNIQLQKYVVYHGVKEWDNLDSAELWADTVSTIIDFTGYYVKV